MIIVIRRIIILLRIIKIKDRKSGGVDTGFEMWYTSFRWEGYI